MLGAYNKKSTLLWQQLFIQPLAALHLAAHRSDAAAHYAVLAGDCRMEQQ